MNALLLAAVAAASPVSAPADIDLRCYRVMADLARADDPAVRTLGITAAHYFLGRIDAASPGFEAGGGAPIGEAERPALLRRCGDLLSESGFDLRALDASLARPGPTI